MTIVTPQSLLARGLAAVKALDSQPVLDKKRTIILLRSVVVIATSYLILFGDSPTHPFSIAYIIALVLSNGGLVITPREWFNKPAFSAILLLADTVVVLAGLYLTVGCFSQDFLIIYFFTIFLTTATHGIAQIAVGSALISGLYGYWLSITVPHDLAAGEWLRLPFFFIVAVFYAYMTEETKHERWLREQTERELAHLRFLLTLTGRDAEGARQGAVLDQLGSLIEAAFPHLRCAVSAASPALPPSTASVCLPLSIHGKSYGALTVTTTDGSTLRPDEEYFCRVVAATAAGVQYGVEQTNAAQESRVLKQQFLGIVSHELRTPLHAILGYSDILETVVRDSRSPVGRKSIERLRANTQRLQEIIDDMLSLARLRAGDRHADFKPVDLRQLFASLSESVRRELSGRPITFESEIASGIRIVRTDATKLQQIIRALLSNAMKFTQRGAIALRAVRGADQTLEIAVSDTGIGMATEQVDVAFEEFRQLDASLTRPFDGLGIGLALVRELAEILGGHVEVESQQEHGSVFRLRLPLGDTNAGDAMGGRRPAAGHA